MMDPIPISELIDRGIVGVVLAAVLLGWLQPKYVADEAKKRESIKDEIIERQATLIEKLAAKRAGLDERRRHTDPKDADDA